MMKFVAKDQNNPAEFVLKNGVNLVGRDESCDIMIDSNHISRNHISCVVSRDRVVIQDLNSRNGTFVNGLRVKNSVEIKNGDVISLGKYTMVFAEDPEEGEDVLPSMVVLDGDEESDEPYRGDTLPLKGEMARRGGEEHLPAKYDANRYAVTTRDNKIVVSNGATGDAMELYRGGPDSMTLDHLIAERRARQRRNMILAIAGGAFVLALVLVLVVAMQKSEPKRTRRKIDKEKYYLALNKAVELYTTGKLIEAETKLDEAKKIVGNSPTYNLHEQLRSLFDVCDQLDSDWQNLNTTEANKIFNYVIDLDDLPEHFDIRALRNWLTEKKSEFRSFATDKLNWEAGEAISLQILSNQNVRNRKAIDALKSLRKIRASNKYKEKKWKEFYTNNAWQAEKTVSMWLVKDILGEDPNDLETDIKDITVDRAMDMFQPVTEVIEHSDNIVVDNELKRKLSTFRNYCYLKIETDEKKKAAVEEALGYYGNEEYLKAKEALKEFRDERENAVIKDLIRSINLALDVFAAYENAKKYYNAGDGEEALEILNSKIDDALQISSDLHNKYDRLKRNVESVLGMYKEAMAAQEIFDVLKVLKICEEMGQLIELEEDESNFYYDWALREAGSIDMQLDEDNDVARKKIASNYVAQAEVFFRKKEYLDARKFAEIANDLYPDINLGEIVLNNLSRRGQSMLIETSALHDDGKTQQALEIIEMIIEQKIYKNGDGVLDVARQRRENWRADK